MVNESVQTNSSFNPQNMQWGMYAPQANTRKNGKSTKEQIDSLTHWLNRKEVPEGNRKVFIEEESGALLIPMKPALYQLVEEIIAGKIGAVLVLSLVWLFQDGTGIECNTFANVCKEHDCVLVAVEGMVFDFNTPTHITMYRHLVNEVSEILIAESG